MEKSLSVNYINITMVRHAQSLANVYTEEHIGINATDPIYTDAKLSDFGKYQIESLREQIISKIGDDYKLILTSPLKRAIQTCQLVLKNINTNDPKNKRHVCNLLAEVGDIVENRFDIKDTNNDYDILSLPNYDKIQWNGPMNNSSSLMKEMTENYKPDFSNDDKFYSDLVLRIKLIKKFFNNINNINNILIFTHWGVIKELTDTSTGNLSMVKFRFNCNDQTIDNIKHIPIEIPQNIISMINTDSFDLEINILSYNICYQCMENKKEGTVSYLCNDTCKTNITNFIDSELNKKDYHFIGLQEASNYNYIIQNTPKLQTMNFEHYRPYLEDMILFYDETKYKLDRNYMVKSWMKDAGRPFMILFFNNNICVINIHAGHKNDITQFDNHLQDTFKGLKKNSLVIGEEAEILLKIKTYNIICMGDFNKSISSEFQILKRPLYGHTISNTCCDSIDLFKKNYNINSGEYVGSYDQILTSWANANQTIVHNPPPPASDHLPVSRIVILPILGGKDNMYKKYMKYKYKYMQLKNNNIII